MGLGELLGWMVPLTGKLGRVSFLRSLPLPHHFLTRLPIAFISRTSTHFAH